MLSLTTVSSCYGRSITLNRNPLTLLMVSSLAIRRQSGVAPNELGFEFLKRMEDLGRTADDPSGDLVGWKRGNEENRFVKVLCKCHFSLCPSSPLRALIPIAYYIVDPASDRGAIECDNAADELPERSKIRRFELAEPLFINSF